MESGSGLAGIQGCAVWEEGVGDGFGWNSRMWRTGKKEFGWGLGGFKDVADWEEGVGGWAWVD
jgi:hypothetical protein